MTTQKCLTILVVSTPPPGRIAVSIRDLDMEVDKKENFCVDYVDVSFDDVSFIFDVFRTREMAFARARVFS